MLTITEEARDHAREKGGVLYLEYIVVQGCCIPCQPEPTVRFGEPHEPRNYRREKLEGISVFVPHDLPDVSLVIKASAFMGFRRLVVEGWRHA
jgi:hypothetical protein